MTLIHCTNFALAFLALALSLSLSNLPLTSASFETFNFTFTSLTEEELIEKFISQDGSIEFSNINASPHILNCTRYYTGGHSMGYAWLNDDNVTLTDVHLLPDEGIILSSGDPLDFIYNDEDNQTTIWGDFPNDTLYDEDLANAINDTRVFDACFLEFDFKCSGEGYVPQVSFKYMFGSDEYHEYVFSQFNDAFALLLNGVNIAKLPSTETDVEVVSINNVNLQLNRQYFHGNDPDCTAGVSMVYPQIEPDGFTVILTALGTPHQNPDQTNTIKIVVGDIGDQILDSWVLLEGSSFSCVPISTSAPSGKSGKSSAPSISSKSGKSRQSAQPSESASAQPSFEPSLAPSVSSEPSVKPSSEPSLAPSLAPSVSSEPSVKPSSKPSSAPLPTSSSSKSGKSRSEIEKLEAPSMMFPPRPRPRRPRPTSSSNTNFRGSADIISDLLGTDPMAAAFGTTAAHGSQRENSKAPSPSSSGSKRKSKSDKDMELI